MRKYEDFIEGLQKDVEVPTDVSRGFDNALNNLSDSPKGGYKSHKWITAIAGTAAVLAISTGVLMANPVLAAKIPIIGKIFERVENKVTYPGDFKDKAEVLTTEPVSTETAVADDVATIDTKETYVVEDQGMTFTASEVYCDGYSLYLTAKVESRDGGFNDMTGYMNEDGDGERVKHLYAWGGGQTDGGVIGENEQQSMEGDVIDDNTFVGMMKLDFAQAVSGSGTFDLNLTMLGFDSKSALEASDSIDVTNRYDGNWKLAIPYTVDTKDTKTVEVNEDAVNGFIIDKVVVSPYQMLIYMNAPYTTVTEENFGEIYGELNEELIESEQAPVGFEDGAAEKALKKEEMLAAGMDPAEIEETFSNKHYHEFDLAVFNQSGEKIEWRGATLVDDQWVAKYSVKGLDISKLQLFLNDEGITLVKAKNIDEAKGIALWNTEINIK